MVVLPPALEFSFHTQALSTKQQRQSSWQNVYQQGLCGKLPEALYHALRFSCNQHGHETTLHQRITGQPL